MGRKKIKMDAGREDYENGSFLERDERFETDAEWHGRILDDIETNLNYLQSEFQSHMPDLVRALVAISESLQEISQRSLPLKQDIKPLSSSRFTINWIMIFLLMLLYKAS